MRMKKVFPEEYNFFPQTWLLPYDSVDFRAQFAGLQNTGAPRNYSRTLAKKAKEKAAAAAKDGSGVRNSQTLAFANGPKRPASGKSIREGSATVKKRRPRKMTYIVKPEGGS